MTMASPVVIDLGSHAIRAGKPVSYPNDHEPSVVRKRWHDF